MSLSPRSGAVRTVRVPGSVGRRMELVLVRHAQPQWYVDDIHQGIDPTLSELGFEQAERLADELADEHFDEIWVSPMLRARLTAAPLLARLGRDEEIAPWLKEIVDPPMEGRTKADMLALYEAEHLAPLADRWNGLPGGERIDDFHERINDGLAGFLAPHGIAHHDGDVPCWTTDGTTKTDGDDSLRILCVAHGGTNAVLTAALLGANRVPFEWFRFWYGHTTIGRLTARTTSGILYFALQGLETPHLPKAMRTH
jgi:2,3-bisphosphoglycerate-dependent phosphoglycerate mutase